LRNRHRGVDMVGLMSVGHAGSSPDSTDAEGPSLALCLVLASLAGIAVGALTAYAQGWLEDSVGSLANSAGPWSLAAFVLARHARRVALGIFAAMVTLVCCELGYAIATDVRGGANATSTIAFWLTAAVLAGPPLGVAGAWSTGTGLRRSVGFAVIGGVLIGEGLYGWSTISQSTDWRYWAAELMVGVAVVVSVVVSDRRLVEIITALATSVLVAGAVFGAARLA